MILSGSSLNQLLDSLAEHRGLTREELVECVKEAIVETFRQKGRVVTVDVEDVTQEASIRIQEMLLGNAGSRPFYREVKLIPAVRPELLVKIIEERQLHKAANQTWLLSETRVIRVEDDHYLLELIGSVHLPSAEGKVAVLPTAQCNEGDRFGLGDNVWVAFKPHVHTKIEGGFAESWRNVDAPYIATRSESNFLTLMAMQMLGDAVQGVIHTSRGLLIFPAGTDLKPLLAENCKHKNILQRLCGLARLVMARQSPSEKPDKKLIHAIGEVAELKYGLHYKIGAEDPNKLPCVYVAPEKAHIFFGKGGSNIFFIKCVVQFDFEAKVPKFISRKSR